MTRKKDRRAVLVGMFIFVGLGALLAALITIGKQRSVFESSLLLHARFADVNGLLKGNNVWYAGVKIGTVKNIEIAPDGIASVSLRINEKASAFVNADSRVKIASDGLIGNRLLVIYGGTKGRTVHDGDTLATAIPTNTAELMNTLQESNKNVSDITGDLKVVSKRLANGEGTVGKLLTTDSLARQLQQTAGVLQAAAINMNSFSARMAGYSAQLQRRGTIAHELVADTLLYRNLQNAAADIKQAAVAARSSSEQVSLATARLNDSNNVAGVLLNNGEAANDIKVAIGNMQAGTQKFDESMEALQHNFLLRRYFKKKGKTDSKKQAPATGIIAVKDGTAAQPIAQEK